MTHVTDVERKLLDVLQELSIPFVRHEHPPVATVEEAEKHWAHLNAAHCKNLFLRNYKGNRHYLVIAGTTKKVDLKALNRMIGEDRLSFASPQRLMRHLGIEPGSVSPFGLINDINKEVQVVLDEDLMESEALGFHPNINTATLVVSREDFVKFLSFCGNRVRSLKL